MSRTSRRSATAREGSSCRRFRRAALQTHVGLSPACALDQSIARLRGSGCAHVSDTPERMEPCPSPRTDHALSRGTTMSIRTTILAGLLSLPLAAGGALAAESGKRSLADAVRQGDHEAVRALLNGTAKDDVVGAEGMAALIAAASRNDLEIADLLLRAGVDVNAPLLSSETPLMDAARRGNLATVRVLLSGNADPNAKEANEGQTAL